MLQTSIALLITLASTWPLFVFGGSQLAYLVAVIASACLAALLSHLRTPWAVVFLAAQFALLGPEASGELAPGEPLVGSLRITDATLLAAVAGLGFRLVTTEREGWILKSRAVLATARSAPIELKIAAVLGAWTLALWIANGAPLGPATKADLRWIFVAVASVCVGLWCRPRSRSGFILGLLAVGSIAAVKVLAIYLTDHWAIGNFDRLQASRAGTAEDPRVILVGGDTLLVLLPAIGALAASAIPDRRVTRAAVGATCLSLTAIVISGTRTNVLIALVLGLGVWLLMHPGAAASLRRPRIAVALLAASGALAAGIVATGLDERFTAKDPPHVGLNLRADEIQTFTSLPDRDVFLGQGVGGTFVGRDVNGELEPTGWSHVLPVWLALKGGVVALVGFLALLALFALRASRVRSTKGWMRRDLVLGATLVAGTVALSFTLGRVGLPEGALLTGFGVALVYQPQTR